VPQGKPADAFLALLDADPSVALAGWDWVEAASQQLPAIQAA